MSLRQANILDEPQPTLPPLVWDDPSAPEPKLRPQHAHFITSHIYKILEHGGYPNPHEWLHLYLTGSLCTYQYGANSDCDISVFVISSKLPEWSRAEMIGLMIEGTDGVTLPGTPYELQAYVVARGIHPGDLYRPGLRPGYDIAHHKWISPPDHRLVHDVKAQENGFYAWALQQSDKMEKLLRYEPDKAVDFWHQIHRKRIRDERDGKGDYSESNILYKLLVKRGLTPEIAGISGEHIATFSAYKPWGRGTPDYTDPGHFEYGWRFGDLGRKYPWAWRRNTARDQGLEYYQLPAHEDAPLSTRVGPRTHDEHAAQLGEMYAYGHIDEPTLQRLLGNSDRYLADRASRVPYGEPIQRTHLTHPKEWQDIVARRYDYLRNQYLAHPGVDTGSYESQIAAANALGRTNGVEPLSLGYPSESVPMLGRVTQWQQQFTPPTADEPAPMGVVQQPVQCPWCLGQHPHGFDTNECPRRLEQLRNKEPMSFGPDEPARLSHWQQQFAPPIDVGQFKQSKVASAIGEAVLYGLHHNGGITIGMRGDQPQSGYAFAPSKTSEIVIPGNQLTPQAIDAYIAQHQTELQQPGHYVGGWMSGNDAYLDISVVENDMQRAMSMAAQADQLAIFHLDSGEEIPVQQPATMPV